LASARRPGDNAQSTVHLSVMPPPSPSFWVAAVSSLLLLACFSIFLVDGLHNGLQRIATVVVGSSAALLGGHAGAVWRQKTVKRRAEKANRHVV
jgi:hypothetical protein